MARSRLLLLGIGLLTAALASLPPDARGQALVQIGPWRVERVQPADGQTPFCQARAPFARPDARPAAYEARFETRENGSTSLVLTASKPAPAWLRDQNQSSPAERRVEGCRFWFDDRPLWPLRYVTRAEPAETRYDLGGDPQCLSELSQARHLKLETEPGAASEQNHQRQIQGRHREILSLNEAPRLVQALRSCLVALRDSDPPKPVTLDGPARPLAPPESVAVQLAAARQALQQAKETDPAAQTEDCPEGQLPARLRLGRLAADALRLGEAHEILLPLRNLAPTPAVRQGLLRLFEVDLLAERLDEAFEVAKTLPENEHLLAAVALCRGDYEGAQLLVRAAAGRVLGLPIPDWKTLAQKSVQDDRMELADGRAEAMRAILLAWGLAALGQEQALTKEACANCLEPKGELAPAASAAYQVANWLGEDALRDDAPDNPRLRRDLGLAAFLRGASLLRAGYLQPVQTDFAYALYELQDADADGWIWRTKVAQVRLMAAQNRSSEALDKIRALAFDIVGALGKDSLPWIEAEALESELALRLGERETAVATARAALAVANAMLPRDHSLALRLKRVLCSGMLAQGDAPGAVGVAMDALGLATAPYLDQDRLASINRRLAEHPEPDLARPPSLTNEGQFQRAKAAKLAEDRARGEAIRAKHDILIEELGLPAMAGNLPVAARLERIRFVGPITALVGRQNDPALANGLEMTGLALSLDESRASARLEGSYVGGGLSYADSLVSLVRGASVITNDRLLPPGLVGMIATKLAAIPLYMSALNWLSLSSMFPGDNRQSLTPGEATQGLEDLLDALRRGGSASGPAAATDQSEFQQALVHVQAATRGEVLANILTRAWLVGDPGVDERYRRKAQQAIDGELWLRRQRGILLDTLTHPSALRSEVAKERPAVRRAYLPMAYYGGTIGTKFSAHVLGFLEGSFKALETMSLFGSVKYEFKVKEALAHLGGDEAIVVWMPLERSTHVFVVAKTGCLWTTIPEGQVSLARRVRVLRVAMDTVWDLNRQGRKPETVPFPVEEAHALYRTLLGPLEETLGKIKHLYTVQLGAVGSLPLGLLVTRPPASGQEPAWLADRFAITRMPALINPGILAQPRVERPKKARLLLAAGDPRVQPPAAASGGQAPSPVPGSLRALDDSLKPLENAQREMDAVAENLGLSQAERERFVLSGPAATPQAVLDSLRHNRFKYLLFATHGLVTGQDVGEPALLLSPQSGRRGPDDDGLLRASDVVGTELDTDLVILSACQTAPSGEDGAEPLAGLVSAFLVAGARAAVSTQWPVDTKAAQYVSTALIDGLRRGDQKPAVVLQRVLRNLRDQGLSGNLGRNPAAWAAFELVAFPR